MPIFTRECIENLKSHINIYDVVSRAVTLKRSGRNWVGLSPFSNEKTPSFFVLPEKGIFKCFSSGLAGDIFRFVEETEKLTFTEAVEMLAERFNLPLEYERGAPRDREPRSLRREILEIHDYAADFYHRALMAEHPHSRTVREYWTGKRGFPLELATEFRIGFAPVGSRKLNELLQGKGFSLEALKKCGLFYARDTDRDPLTLKNRFEGRLMIPIRDYQGQVIAFTARQLELTPASDPAREAKYVNSPETPVFHKSRLVFNLERAREAIDAEGRFTLVEGQLDALRCWHCGIRATIAPQGTSITEEQLRLLTRYSRNLDVVLDGDSAGQKAAVRMLPLALRVGLEVRFITLPAGADPDSLLVSEGLAGFERLRAEAENAMTFGVRALFPDAQAGPRARAEAMSALFEIIAQVDSAMVRSEYLEELIHLSGADPAAVRSDFERFLRGRRHTPAPPAPAPENDRRPAPAPAPGQSKLTTATQELLWIVLQDDHWAEALAPVMDHEWIDDSTMEGKLLGRILAEVNEGTWEGLRGMDYLLETRDERDFFYAALAEERHFDDPVKIANQCIESLMRRKLKQQIEELDNRIANCGPDPDRLRVLFVERQVLTRRLCQPETRYLTSAPAVAPQATE